MRIIVNDVRSKLFVSLIGAMAGILAAQAETITGTPDAYLDYIEATGTQYINTGVNAETGLKARADFSWGSKVKDYDDWGLLGAKDGQSGDSSTRMLMIHLGNNKPYIGYGLAGRGQVGTILTRDVRGEILADFSDYNALQVYQDGTNTLTATQQATYAALGNVDLGIPLYAFAYNQAGAAGGKCKAKLYELKIMKKNGSGGFDIVRHYLPCRKNGRAALYDKANGTISFSDSGTDFVEGTELPRPCELVEWIESLNSTSGGGDGNYYIDTRVYGKSGIKSEVDCMIRSGFTTDQAILACRWDSNNTRFFLAYFYNSYFGYGYKSGYWPNNVPVQNNKDYRYRIESELSAGSQSVKVNGTELHKEGVAHDSEFFSPRTTLTLFALHTGNGNSYPARSNIRLFSTKLWDGDELLRDFVPCVDSVGEAGLYDRVTERVFKSPTAYSLATQVGGCTNWLSLAEGTLPDAKISYIESDGTNDYFDVGVMAKDGVEMEAVMEWLTVPTDGAFVSARTSTLRFFPYHYYKGYHRLGYASQLYGFGTAAVAKQLYKVLTRLDNGSQTASISAFVNGAWEVPRSISQTATGPVDMGLSLYLFARNYEGKADYPGHARVYKLKLSEKQQDGTYKLTRDFVPVMKDGKAMLYDKVSGRFFRNRGRYLAIGGGEERLFMPGLVIRIK